MQDEYIHLNNIGKPQARGGGANACNSNGSKASSLSKFERYRHQDADDDEMEEGNFFFSFCSLILENPIYFNG